jgi:hypothetical protein
MIACIFMVIDHVGLTFFPDYDLFRILGRIAFPLFAFFIAEGSRYSKHWLRRFLLIFTIGIVFFLFYFIYDGTLYGNIFLTFSVSIILDRLLYTLKKAIFEKTRAIQAVLLSLLFACALASVYFIYTLMHFEYRFFGMLLPVMINLVNFKDIKIDTVIKKLDNHVAKVALAFIGCILLSVDGNLGAIQYYCLLAIIPLIFYNGKVGIKGMKYAFYIFYPAHLVIIEGIAILLTYLN